MRRLTAALMLLGLLVAVPVAFLVVRALASADIEEANRHRAIAERAFDEMEESLSRLLAEEEARPFDAYRFYSRIDRAESGRTTAVTRSVLADPPAHDFIIGYFQIDPDGSLHTPRIPRDLALAREHGDLPPLEPFRELEHTLREAWTDRRATSGRAVNRLAATDSQEAGAGKSEGLAKRLLGALPLATAPMEAARAPVQESAPGSYDEVYRSFNRAPERRAERKQKVTSVPAPQAASLPSGRQHLRDEASAAFRSKPDAGTARMQPSANASAAGAPEPSPAVSPGTVRVALDPMVGRETGDGHLLLYRTVLVGQQGYRQGLLIDWRRLGAWLEAQVIAPSALRDARVSFRGADPAAPPPSQTGGYAFAHRFAEPFDAFGVELGLPPLPGGRGSGTIHALAVLLAVVTAGGLFAVYRMAAVVVRFADRRSRFVAAVSHELKTPLTAIRMYGEMLRDGLVANETKRDEYYRTITDESERLSRLIDNVLDYSRLEKGEYEAVPRPVEPVPVVRAAVEKLRPHALQAGFSLELDADGPLPRVAFDRDVLTQVVFNLVDNATKYARDADVRRIVVACRDVDDARHVEVSVRDHGPGVPARDLGRIFEAFYRRGDELTRTTKGTGIGLALVKDLVESLGGTVSATNAPGGGLRVAVRLPLAPPD